MLKPPLHIGHKPMGSRELILPHVSRAMGDTVGLGINCSFP